MDNWKKNQFCNLSYIFPYFLIKKIPPFQQKVVVWPQLPGRLGVLDFVVRTTLNYHFMFDVAP